MDAPQSLSPQDQAAVDRLNQAQAKNASRGLVRKFSATLGKLLLATALVVATVAAIYFTGGLALGFLALGGLSGNLAAGALFTATALAGGTTLHTLYTAYKEGTFEGDQEITKGLLFSAAKTTLPCQTLFAIKWGAVKTGKRLIWPVLKHPIIWTVRKYYALKHS